jgi:hypothetical protein
MAQSTLTTPFGLTLTYVHLHTHSGKWARSCSFFFSKPHAGGLRPVVSTRARASKLSRSKAGNPTDPRSFSFLRNAKCLPGCHSSLRVCVPRPECLAQELDICRQMRHLQGCWSTPFACDAVCGCRSSSPHDEVRHYPKMHLLIPSLTHPTPNPSHHPCTHALQDALIPLVASAAATEARPS